ncbi:MULTISPECIES: DUF2129 domain-containing protein [unclassified Streptococcus]|uniref:DUF2129 domain-containing protein n=1 Tax=unclassified Streptococcus TaxID=2608887 RepID=UPI0010722DF8|nr:MULTISPECIES: DUF2129 domain-containing protein [unclassified Streptococcus]MBF0806003.1 DUF2129 domain-containing protein [Streptococcus sp. 19428wA2_WM07]TFU28408.1 DUF2129 domain-containing protein [Streptococcus sp. WM07]
METRVQRRALYVYLYYNRDRRKLFPYGDITYHSRRMRYVQLFVQADQAGDIRAQLEHESFVREVKTSHLVDLPLTYQGIDLAGLESGD